MLAKSIFLRGASAGHRFSFPCKARRELERIPVLRSVPFPPPPCECPASSFSLEELISAYWLGRVHCIYYVPTLIYKKFFFQFESLVQNAVLAQSCPLLCDPTDCSPPGSNVHGISQARILERVAISFSRDRTQVSCISSRFFTI